MFVSATLSFHHHRHDHHHPSVTLRLSIVQIHHDIPRLLAGSHYHVSRNCSRTIFCSVWDVDKTRNHQNAVSRADNVFIDPPCPLTDEKLQIKPNFELWPSRTSFTIIVNFFRARWGWMEKPHFTLVACVHERKRFCGTKS